MIRHPARFSSQLLPVLQQLLVGATRILDPLAGTGKIVQASAPGQDFYLNDLEPEWIWQAANQPCVKGITICDAAHLPFMDGWFSAICTSPAYGNRMADHHEAKDASRRNTYRHSLGRPLTEGNTGSMQWGRNYRIAHRLIWRECHRVLAPNGLFILNISDHYRKGKVIPVTDWHIEALMEYEFELVEHRKVETPRLRHGANSALRVPFESIVVMRKAG